MIPLNDGIVPYEASVQIGTEKEWYVHTKTLLILSLNRLD